MLIILNSIQYHPYCNRTRTIKTSMRRIIITATPNYIQEIRILVEICHSYKYLIIYGAVRRYKISGRRPKRTTNAVKEFEEKHNALVYHSILVPTIYGRLLNMLYISKYTEEWQRDREELNEGLPLAYCKNLEDDTMSEFGTIQIAGANGGITRIA